jgi:hypothetical protein
MNASPVTNVRFIAISFFLFLPHRIAALPLPAQMQIKSER